MKIKLELSLDAVVIAAIQEVSTLLNKMNRRLTTMSTQLDALAAQVAKNTSIEESAVTLIRGIAQQLADAKDDPVKIQQLSDSLAASAGDLSGAISENTPATDTGGGDTGGGENPTG